MEVTTINVRGLGNQHKRNTLFHWLDTKRFKIICLQETFCTEQNVQNITNNWEGKSYHSTSPSNHSKGVSILFHKSFHPEVIDCHTSNDGRKILLNISHNGNTYSIVNIYAPTEEKYRSEFFNKTKKWILDKALNTNCMILCGDYNCSLSSIDRRKQNVDRSRGSLKDYISFLDVHDL